MSRDMRTQVRRGGQDPPNESSEPSPAAEPPTTTSDATPKESPGNDVSKEKALPNSSTTDAPEQESANKTQPGSSIFSKVKEFFKTGNMGVGVGVGTGTGVSPAVTGEEEGTFSKIFHPIYMIIVAFAMIFVLLFVIIAFMNMIKILLLKSKQNRVTKYNDLILRDVMEYKFFQYSAETIQPNCKRTNKMKQAKNEPLLNLYAAITVTSLLYNIVGVFIVMVGAHLGISIILYYRQLTSNKPNLSTMKDVMPKINKNFFLLIGASVTVAFISSIILTVTFVNNAIYGTLRDFNKKAYTFKRWMYSNLYVEGNFLNMLYNDNYDAALDMILSKISQNMEAATKMIFTYNVYIHYISSFTVSNPYMQDFKNRFSYESLKNMRESEPFEPLEFLIYTDDISGITFQNHFLKHIQANIQANQDKNSVELRNAYMNNKYRGVTLHDQTMANMRNLNNLTKEFTITNLEKSYKSILSVVKALFGFAIAILVIAIISMYLYDPTGETFKRLVSLITQPFIRFKNMIQSIFKRT